MAAIGEALPAVAMTPPAAHDLIPAIQKATANVLSDGLRLPTEPGRLNSASAVLFLIGSFSFGKGRPAEPCLVLNKRSVRVAQPGDLCCPGGGIEPRIDFSLGRLMQLPGFPGWRWPYWGRFAGSRAAEKRILLTLMATAVRESVEEMRLNPFCLRFLGLLPKQELVLFTRRIYPLVGWLSIQTRFFPNWEVEKIVRIPLQALLNPAAYVRYRLQAEGGAGNAVHEGVAFRHCHRGGQEILWGATFRITLNFLKLVFGFSPPPMADLPPVNAVLEKQYMAGRRP